MIEPLTRANLRGIWHALIVPWTEADELDEKRFASEIRSYAGTGIHGLYTGGTTGEFYAQDDGTFERVSAVACAEARALELPIQIGCTALSTRTVVRRIKAARSAGADAIQIAVPFWLDWRDEDMEAFLRDAAAAADPLPLILYHTSRAKRKFSPERLVRLADEVPALIGVKDGCDLDTLKTVLSGAPDLAMFGGDGDLAERLEAGGRGAYCAVTGLNAKLMVAIYELAMAGDLEAARPLQHAVRRLLDEQIVPLIEREGIYDSALDRLMRTAGGGDVGLRCQKPYASATPRHVELLRAWCEENEPILMTFGLEPARAGA